MKVLWITNSFFPEAKELLTGEQASVKGSGGWLSASAEQLVTVNGIQLAVVAISNLVNKLTKLQGKRILYYVMPLGKGNIKINKEYIPYWQKINEDFKPDLIHLHGTELSHGWSLLEALPEAKTIISIQGLMSQICKYYTYGMTKSDVLCNITLRDFIHDIVKRKEMSGSLIRKQKNYEIKGRNELLIYKKAKAVIGRTMWDRANVLAINPSLNYYFCNETLREEFYSGQWDYGKCVPHTIFLSQATYPFKGLHMMVKALPFIIQEFPDTKIIVAGVNVLGEDDLRGRFLRSGYAKYVKKLMSRLGIEKNRIVFTGPLDADGMKQQYLKCNVFVSPSGIENSPNSVCEAQMLGVPVVASYVGGTADMVSNEHCGYLYRFEDVEMLAHLVKKVFKESSCFDGTYEIEVAHQRHDGIRNLEQLIKIYNAIIK